MTSSDWLDLSDEELFQSRAFIGDWLEERGHKLAKYVGFAKIDKDLLGTFRTYHFYDDGSDYYASYCTYEEAQTYIIYRIRQILIDQIQQSIYVECERCAGEKIDTLWHNKPCSLCDGKGGYFL